MKTVTFGEYWFGKEDEEFTAIEWLILDRRPDGTTLLITKDCIDSCPYTDTFLEDEDVSWENCDLNKWLNSYFFDVAFDGNQKDLLLDVDSIIQDGIEQKTKITILSAEEVRRYFPNRNDRRAAPTPWADRIEDTDEDEGIYIEDGFACWYLRDPSKRIEENYTMVLADGEIDLDGADFFCGRVQCVRPVVLVKKSFPTDDIQESTVAGTV